MLRSGIHPVDLRRLASGNLLLISGCIVFHGSSFASTVPLRCAL